MLYLFFVFEWYTFVLQFLKIWRWGGLPGRGVLQEAAFHRLQVSVKRRPQHVHLQPVPYCFLRHGLFEKLMRLIQQGDGRGNRAVRLVVVEVVETR